MASTASTQEPVVRIEVVEIIENSIEGIALGFQKGFQYRFFRDQFKNVSVLNDHNSLVSLNQLFATGTGFKCALLIHDSKK